MSWRRGLPRHGGRGGTADERRDTPRCGEAHGRCGRTQVGLVAVGTARGRRRPGRRWLAGVVHVPPDLCLGTAEVGNWNLASHRNRTPVRFLTGAIDEMMLYSSALSDEDVARLYEHGRPPR